MDSSGNWRTWAVVVTLVLAVGSVGLGTAGPPAAAQPSIVVDDDGTAAYQSIDAAVNNASSGARIEVRPGIYTESVTVAKNVTLVAPDGATIQNASGITDRAGLRISGAAAPTIEGLTLTGWQWGVSAGGTDGDWTLRGLTLRNNTELGIGAAATDGDWTVVNTTIVGAPTDEDFGISAFGSSGNWAIRQTTIRGADEGVFAEESTGAWTIHNTTIRNAQAAVDADQSAGDWRITGSRLDSTSDYSIEAKNSTGSWAVHQSALVESDVKINATGAAIAGNATQNWWGQASGPDANDCVGAVDCSAPLSSPPGSAAPPTSVPNATDPDGDGVFEDLNGDNAVSAADVTVAFELVVTGQSDSTLDINGQGDGMTAADVTALFNAVVSGQIP